MVTGPRSIRFKSMIIITCKNGKIYTPLLNPLPNLSLRLKFIMKLDRFYIHIYSTHRIYRCKISNLNELNGLRFKYMNRH